MLLRVILCTHNGANFVREQLQSILGQERPVDKVHLFDFASVDGTRAILGEFAAAHPHIELTCFEDAPGVASSFFRAFAAVQPECGVDDLIFLSDQDDVWHAEKTRVILEAYADAGHSTPVPMLLFHDVIICDAQLRETEPSHYTSSAFRIPRDLTRERLLIANPVIGNTIAMSPTLMNLALACIRPEHYVMHDWALVLLAAHAGQIIPVQKTLSHYRQHNDNILGVAQRRSLPEYIRRAIRLANGVHRQTAAFDHDIRMASRANGSVLVLALPGGGPLAWRLGLAFIRDGHTVGHKLMALIEMVRLVLPARAGTSR